MRVGGICHDLVVRFVFLYFVLERNKPLTFYGDEQHRRCTVQDCWENRIGVYNFDSPDTMAVWRFAAVRSAKCQRWSSRYGHLISAFSSSEKWRPESDT